MKKICLTYDYELFFGPNSGTPLESIIKPTKIILASLKRYDLLGTFFVDVLYLIKLIEVEEEHDNLNKIESQLIEIVKSGHRIELHLHPHWLDAKYDNGKWEFESYDHFMLNSLSLDKVIDLFNQGTTYLESIVNQVDPEYKVLCFRAGGWCIQPFDNLKHAFYLSGLKLDSSVAKEMFEDNSRKYDFRNSPNLSHWKFLDDPLVNCSYGKYIEAPIYTYNEYFFDRFIENFLIKVFKCDILGDGSCLIGKDMGFLNKFKKRKKMLTTDSTFSFELKRVIQKTKSDLYVIINHPKTMKVKLLDSNMKVLSKYKSILLIDLIDSSDA